MICAESGERHASQFVSASHDLMSMVCCFTTNSRRCHTHVMKLRLPTLARSLISTMDDWLVYACSANITNYRCHPPSRIYLIQSTARCTRTVTGRHSMTCGRLGVKSTVMNRVIALRNPTGNIIKLRVSGSKNRPVVFMHLLHRSRCPQLNLKSAKLQHVGSRLIS